MASVTTSSIRIPAVPDSLGERDQWLLWLAEIQGSKEKPQKVSYSARTRRRADPTDPRSWASFSLCVGVWRRFPSDFTGLGYAFDERDGFAGIDLDNCLSEAGSVKPWAQPLLARFSDTYMEVSPSRRGIKIWCKAQLRGKGIHEPVADGAIGLYDRARYFSVTGDRWRDAPLEIEDHQADVTELYQRLSSVHAGSGAWSVNPETSGIIPEGRRHPFLVSLAGTLHRRRVCPQAIAACLFEVNKHQCEPPKDEAEIHRIVRDSTRWR